MTIKTMTEVLQNDDINDEKDIDNDNDDKNESVIYGKDEGLTSLRPFLAVDFDESLRAAVCIFLSRKTPSFS